MEELGTQLERERIRREKLESELDECRNEIVRLVNILRSYEDKIANARQRRPSETIQEKPKKSSSSASNRRQRRVEKETGFVLMRRNSLNS